MLSHTKNSDKKSAQNPIPMKTQKNKTKKLGAKKNAAAATPGLKKMKSKSLATDSQAQQDPSRG